LFTFGDYGDTFYVVLNGEVAVEVPYQVSSEDTSAIIKPFTQVATKTTGDTFGELALLVDQPRAATIRAKVDTHLAVLDKESYIDIVGKADHENLDFVVKILSAIPMFKKWAKASLQRLSYFFSRRRLIRRQFVYQEGDSSSSIYVVVEGEFKLSRKLSSLLGGKPIVGDLAILGQGELFGDDKETMKTSVQCSSLEGEVLVISRENFFRRISNPESWKWYNETFKEQRKWRENRFEQV
jgi:cAMP-dependent protein kinase regulator